MRGYAEDRPDAKATHSRVFHAKREYVVILLRCSVRLPKNLSPLLQNMSARGGVLALGSARPSRRTRGHDSRWAAGPEWVAAGPFLFLKHFLISF